VRTYLSLSFCVEVMKLQAMSIGMHVSGKRKPMRTHKCRRSTCNEQVEMNHLACKEDWFILPDQMRSEIWRAWRQWSAAYGGGSRHSEPGKTFNRDALGEYSEAVKKAVEFWEALDD
jgi:hypothetical protein